jgi:hypothetical protein
MESRNISNTLDSLEAMYSCTRGLFLRKRNLSDCFVFPGTKVVPGKATTYIPRQTLILIMS